MPLVGGSTQTDPNAIASSKAAAASAAASKASSSKAGAAGLDSMGSEAFMKLLVAQMKYQNPMAPSDGTQYLAQISQYAMVEQLQKVNQSQQEVSSYQRALIANSMIGKVVAGTGDTGAKISGQVLGVDFGSGKPVLVTTGGDLAVDKVDESRLPAGSTVPGTASASTSASTSPSTAAATTPAATTPAPTAPAADGSASTSSTSASSTETK